jgi:hypothetical protein
MDALNALTEARLALVRVLAAQHAEGMRLIDLLCAGDEDEDEAPAPPQRQPVQGRLFE